jgi:hypothetical protein
MKARATAMETIVAPYANAPFVVDGEPNRSNVLVMIPPMFDRDAELIWVIIYLHGFETDVSDTPFINTVELGFDAAYGNATNAILVAPQLAFKAKSGESGRLGEKDGLSNLLAEVFEKNKIHGKLGGVVVVSYSGGYQAAINCLTNNDSLTINNLVLLDSWYWKIEDGVDWYDKMPESRRIFSVYSEEKFAQGAKWVASALFVYGGERHINISEEDFLAGKYWADEKIFLIETTKKHGEIPTLLGPILKKVREASDYGQ